MALRPTKVSSLAGSLDAALSAMAKLGIAAPLALRHRRANHCRHGPGDRLGSPVRGCRAGRVLRRAAVLFHTKFGIRNELLHFQKDLAIAGGMLILAAAAPEAWSIDGLVAARRLAGNKARLPAVSDCTADLAEQG